MKYLDYLKQDVSHLDQQKFKFEFKHDYPKMTKFAIKHYSHDFNRNLKSSK